MKTYLIENIGEAEQPITLIGEKDPRWLGRGQNLLVTEEEIAPEIIAWANQSIGLRVTERAAPAPEPVEAPADGTLSPALEGDGTGEPLPPVEDESARPKKPAAKA